MVARRIDDEDVIVAAILHDVLEDTECTDKELYLGFGQAVTSLVCQVTDKYTPEDYPTWNRERRKRAEAQRYENISDKAKLIKHMDIAHNISSIAEHNPKFAVTYLRDMADQLEALTKHEVRAYVQATPEQEGGVPVHRS
jgi:(p)ppGpp synthase/HD superfamily hydrolase